MADTRERDDMGRFMPGHTISKGIGRPPKAKEERLHTTLITKLDDDTWGAIIDKAIEQAKQGDPLARKFLASYALGTPVHRSDDTGTITPEDWLNAMRDDPEPTAPGE